MTAHSTLHEQICHCPDCRSRLTSDDLGLRCTGCGKMYPVVAGIPLLVREPAAYLQAECAALIKVADAARHRQSLLEHLEPYRGLPDAVLQRHRDVSHVEVAQAETFLALLKQSTPAPELEHLENSGAVRPGWNFDTLVPYLLRDWTDTSELRTAGSRIVAALHHAFPDPRGKIVACAGCGAGGLLAELPPDFEHILGFDLTLPILAAARRLLDGKTLDLALPCALHDEGLITLGRADTRSQGPRANLAAMDALDMAFPDASVDCVVTVFLTDILPDPCALASEIHRVLSKDGVWINYGPSGNNLKALWRFDQSEAQVFFNTAGFAVVKAETLRTTNLDITNACPSVSFRSTVCYMTLAQKVGKPEARPAMIRTAPNELCSIVPRHFPGARLIHRLDATETGGILLQHDHIPGREESWELGGGAARMMMLVDGKRTIGEIADLLHRKRPNQAITGTLHAFDRFFKQGLLIGHSARTEFENPAEPV